MTKQLLWSASCAWLVLMGIVWTLFVPNGLSVGTLTLFGLAGPLFLLAGLRALAATRPAPSAR